MNLEEAIIDAQGRANRTGLNWWIIKMKDNTHEAVQDHHLITHKAKYNDGTFKIIGERYSPQSII